VVTKPQTEEKKVDDSLSMAPLPEVPVLEETKSKKLTAVEAEAFLKQDQSDLNMVVAIRVRPMSQKELSSLEFDILSIEDKLLVLREQSNW
jgi:hypothetical protein